MRMLEHRYPRYGTIGLLLLVVMETAVLCDQSTALAGPYLDAITAWTTPVCWWGYILAVAAWLRRRHGGSLLDGGGDRVAMLCLLSIAFWCLFEAYNCLLPGWRYLNLNPHLAIRYLGYAISFASILPGLFLTTELLQSYGLFLHAQGRSVHWSAAVLRGSSLLGAACCLLPPFCPEPVRGYLWGAVWVGFILWLEPINYRRGAQSLYRDWEFGDYSRTLQLLLAGAICGLLWEFWNYWAYTKWVYIFPVPVGASLHYLEMPLIGFLGFLPFALECFVMFHFATSFFAREDKLGL